MNTYLDIFVVPLLKILESSTIPALTKIHAISAIGDLCLSCEHHFEKYLGSTMGCLQQASAVCSNVSLQNQGMGEEFLQIISELRIAIVDAYSSVTHGMLLSKNTAEHVETMKGNAIIVYNYLSALLIGGLVQNVQHVKNIIELIIDLTYLYGRDLQEIIRSQGIAPGIQ